MYLESLIQSVANSGSVKNNTGAPDAVLRESMTDANVAGKITDNGRDNDEKPGKKNNFSKRLPAFFLCLSACATAVFTGLLYHVSDIANNSAIVPQRAFVNYGGPSTVGVTGTDGKVQGIDFYWNVGNSGSTPATNAVSQADVAPISKEIQRDLTSMNFLKVKDTNS